MRKPGGLHPLCKNDKEKQPSIPQSTVDLKITTKNFKKATTPFAVAQPPEILISQADCGGMSVVDPEVTHAVTRIIAAPQL